MSHIFISYARKDIEFVNKIVTSLAEQYIDTWIDWKSIPKGEDWEQEIYRGIEMADALLFLISPDSVCSLMCNKEIAHAIKNSKRILPIVIRDADTTAFLDDIARREIAKRNWIFCREGKDDFPRSIQEIINTIHTDYPWLNFHTKLQVQALDWERGDHEKSLLLYGTELKSAEQQLAASTEKEPPLSRLQEQYVLISRQTADQQRRRVTVIAILGLIVLATLTIFGIIQTKSAQEGQRITFAEQLASQAQSLSSTGDLQHLIAILLAGHSMQIHPSYEAASVLQSSLFRPQISQVAFGNGMKVDSLAFSPDGKYVLSGSSDGTARVWETQSGKEVARMTHTGVVMFVAMIPNSKKALSISSDGNLQILDLATGKKDSRTIFVNNPTFARFSPDLKYLLLGGCHVRDSNGICTEGSASVWDASLSYEIVTVIHHKNGTVDSVAISPDGKYLVTAGHDRTVRVWETRTEKEIIRLNDYEDVNSVAFSQDSRYAIIIKCNENDGGCNFSKVDIQDTANGTGSQPLLSFGEALGIVDKYFVSIGGDNKTARVWEISTGKEISRMTHNDDIDNAALSPDGKYVVSASRDGIARMWETTSGRVVNLLVKQGWTDSIAFSPDNRYIAMSDWYGNAGAWDLGMGDPVSQITNDSPIYVLMLSPDGKYIVTGGADNKARVFTRMTGVEIAEITSDGSIVSLAISRDGKSFVTGSDHGTILVSSLMTGREIFHMSLTGPAHDYYIYAVSFSPDGRYIALGSGDRLVHVLEVATGKEIAKLQHEDIVSSLAFSPDGKYILSGSFDMTGRIWNALSGSEIARIDLTEANAVAFSQDGKYFALAGWNGIVGLFETVTRREIARMSHDGSITSIAFSPDGKLIVTGSEDRTARVWDVLTGKEIAHLNHDDIVTSVMFSPDGNYVISGSNDKSARVWETQTGNEVSRIWHDGAVKEVVFSPDGKYAISGGGDGMIKIQLYRTEDLIAAVCSQIPRNLLTTEWAQYMGNRPYQALCPKRGIDAK